MPIYLGPRRTAGYHGERNVSRDVQQRRRSVEEMLRRMGTPVLVKHRYNDRDVKNGVAEPSPVFDSIYEQTRNEDPLSHGVGFVSVEKSTNEWYNQDGEIVVAASSPGAGWTQAPRFRGFGESHQTYIIEPDRAEDFFKVTTGGPIFKVQTATAIAPWYPDINDNDLIIQAVLDSSGDVLETHERFEAKNVSPITIRGQDRRGRKEYGESFGNAHVVNQTFEMALIPETDVLYDVETDR